MLPSAYMNAVDRSFPSRHKMYLRMTLVRMKGCVGRGMEGCVIRCMKGCVSSCMKACISRCLKVCVSRFM